MLVAAVSTTGVPYVSFPMKNFASVKTPPFKLLLLPVCALLTRDLVAIAKFFVRGKVGIVTKAPG